MKATVPDFGRNLYSVLGIPFDSLTLAQAVTAIRFAVAHRRPCFLSTPNLNFLIAGQTNVEFRQSVVRSDISVADGMPIVWLAKLLGVPIAERVAGSDVFEALRNGEGPLLKVYFFGGPSGVAERAAQQINSESKGMVCVGFDCPGFGSVEDMSSPPTIERINSSGADFLVVSLGAAKGQAWIERNLQALQVPVVSHLGAVVNFVAGSVERAPRWMQKSGLEWLWRIREEPALWRRYRDDGLGLLKLLVRDVVPALYYKRLHRGNPVGTIEASIECDNLSAIRIRLQGADIVKGAALIKAQLARPENGFAAMTLTFSRVTVIPSDLLGVLQMLHVHGRLPLRIFVERVSSYALRQLDQNGCRYESIYV